MLQNGAPGRPGVKGGTGGFGCGLEAKMFCLFPFMQKNKSAYSVVNVIQTNGLETLALLSPQGF